MSRTGRYKCAKSQRNGACLYHAPRKEDSPLGREEFLTEADRRCALKMLERLIELTKEFKTYRIFLIDQTEGDEALKEEQRMLDALEDKIEELNDRLELLVGPPKGMEPPVGTVKALTSKRTDEERRTTLDMLADIL